MFQQLFCFSLLVFYSTTLSTIKLDKMKMWKMTINITNNDLEIKKILKDHASQTLGSKKDENKRKSKGVKHLIVVIMDHNIVVNPLWC